MKSSASSFIAGVAYERQQPKQHQHLMYQHPKQSSSSSVTMTTRLTQHFVNLIDFMSDSNSHATDLFLRQGKHQEAMKQYQNIIETSLDTMNLWMVPSSSSSTKQQQTEAQIRVQQTSPPWMVISIPKDNDIMEISDDEQAMSLLSSQNRRFIVTSGLAEPISILRTTISLSDVDTSSARLFDTLRCWIMCAAVAAIHNSALILLDLHQFADAAEQISNAQSLWEDSMSSYSREECEEFILSNEECMKMMMSLHYVRSKIHIDVCFASEASSGATGSTLSNEIETKPSQELEAPTWPSNCVKEAPSVNQYENQQLQRREFQGWHIVQAINHLTCAYEVGQQVIAWGTAGSDDDSSLSLSSSSVSPSFHQLFQSRTLSWLGFCMLMLGRRQQFDLVLEMYQSAVDCYNRIDEDDNIMRKTTTTEIMNTLHCRNAPAA